MVVVNDDLGEDGLLMLRAREMWWREASECCWLSCTYVEAFHCSGGGCPGLYACRGLLSNGVIGVDGGAHAGDAGTEIGLDAGLCTWRSPWFGVRGYADAVDGDTGVCGADILWADQRCPSMCWRGLLGLVGVVVVANKPSAAEVVVGVSGNKGLCKG